MAAIDKLYLTEDRRDRFYVWCEDNAPTLLGYFYRISAEGAAPFERRGANCAIMFPSWVDMWLMINCPFDFVVSQLRYAHSGGVLEAWPDELASIASEAQAGLDGD